MSNLAVFASGSGSNAENFMQCFSNSDIKITRIFCNNSQAGVIEHAKNFNIPVHIFDRNEFYDTNSVLKTLKNDSTDYIILAGFLWLIPHYLIQAFEKKIINIHPALLPKYGGKGMYGKKVHEAVIANKETQSGITIHLVDEIYDNGKILFQAFCSIQENDTPEILANKIHDLEYEYFPKVIRDYINL